MIKYDADYSGKPARDDIDVEDTVGIDLGITRFIHDSDGRAFRPLDETEERKRIEKRHQALSRKERESNNWTEVRRRLDERTSNYRTSAKRVSNFSLPPIRNDTTPCSSKI